MTSKWPAIVVVVLVGVVAVIAMTLGAPFMEVLRVLVLAMAALTAVGGLLLATGVVQPGKMWGHSPWASLMYTIAFVAIGLQRWFGPPMPFLPFLFIAVGGLIERRARAKAKTGQIQT